MSASEVEIPTHPIQTTKWQRGGVVLPQVVTLAAYEVYSHLYRPQPAMIEGGCRGGFGAGEIIAFLYARSFPKAEWDQRVREALRGMTSD